MNEIINSKICIINILKHLITYQPESYFKISYIILVLYF